MEGKDDEHVLKNLCGQRGVQHLDEIKSLENVERLLDDFPVRLKESDLAALGVIVDADTDLTSRWRSISSRLEQAGYEDVPGTPVSTGTILVPPADSILPRAGVWLMPDNRTPGNLEDFLRFLVPAGSRLMEHAESSVASIPNDERRFNDGSRSKAIIHTWLAWQEHPGRPPGTAITARFLDPRVPEADVLVTWLRQLFFP